MVCTSDNVFGYRSAVDLFDDYDDSDMTFNPPPEMKPKGGKNKVSNSITLL